MKKWNELSISERVPYIKLALDSGITDMNIISERYNRFQEGGDINPYSVRSLTNAVYQSSTGEKYLGKPSHNYDFTMSDEWADAHGYYPDKRGHRDDRVKKPAHPSHPSRGNWKGDVFELTDKGMENPNYTMFGLNDGDQDPQAILSYKGGTVLPEITVTPKGNYVSNPYDNINIQFGDGGWMSRLYSLVPDTWKPKYWNSPEYKANSLKEAIYKAYDDGNKGKSFIYNGKAYIASLNAEDEREYNVRKQHEANRNIRNKDVVHNYHNNVLYVMENPENKGYRNGKYYPYEDTDSKGKKHLNIGPGIEKNSNAGKKLDYSGKTGYTREQLKAIILPELNRQMNEIMLDMHDMYGEDADTVSLGNRMILLDVAHNVKPEETRNNMPKKWRNLTGAMMRGDTDTALENTRSGNDRRQEMRNMLLWKNIVDSNTVVNR